MNLTLTRRLSLSAYKFQEIGPIYYEYGSLIITYDKADIAVKAFYKLRDCTYEERKKDEKEDKSLLVLLLPSVFDAYLEPGVRVSIDVQVKKVLWSIGSVYCDWRRWIDCTFLFHCELFDILPFTFVPIDSASLGLCECKKWRPART